MEDARGRDGPASRLRLLARRAGRRVRRRLPAGRAGRPQSALALLRRIEGREAAVLPTAPGARAFLVHGRAIIAEGVAHEGVSELVPHAVRDALRAGAGQVERVSARVAADVLALAKFDLGQHTKLRAHYPAHGLTVAAQPATTGRPDGVGNALAAYHVVARSAPDLAPRLRGHGRLGEVRYLMEEWIDGAPVLTSAGLALATPAVLDGLAGVHRGHGTELVRCSQAWSEQFPAWWRRSVESGVVAPGVGEQVAALIEADRHVRVSWTHGDLVASNVLRRTDGRVALIDWEHAREGPVMLDGAKLHLFSATPEQTLEDLLAWPAQRWPGRTACTVAQDLALAHAFFLSRYAQRREALAGHDRLAVYERQVRRQAQRLEAVLERAD